MRTWEETDDVLCVSLLSAPARGVTVFEQGEGPNLARRYMKTTLQLMLAGVALLVGGFTFLQLWTGGRADDSSITVANYRAQAVTDRRIAPSFEMPALGGGPSLSLDDFSGNVVVLNFWASWCGPCRLEAPDLQAAWKAYRQRGVQFLGVTYRDDEAAAKAFTEEFHITYPSVFDPSGSLAFEYELIGVPTTFVIDGQGRIRFQFRGYLDGAVLRHALDDVLQETA